MRNALVNLHLYTPTDAQRQSYAQRTTFDAQRQEDLLEKQSFHLLLSNFPPNRDFSSSWMSCTMKYMTSMFSLYIWMPFNFSLFETHFYNVKVTFAHKLCFSFELTFLDHLMNLY